MIRNYSRCIVDYIVYIYFALYAIVRLFGGGNENGHGHGHGYEQGHGQGRLIHAHGHGHMNGHGHGYDLYAMMMMRSVLEQVDLCRLIAHDRRALRRLGDLLGRAHARLVYAATADRCRRRRSSTTLRSCMCLMMVSILMMMMMCDTSWWHELRPVRR